MGEKRPILKEVESSGAGIASMYEYEKRQTSASEDVSMLFATRGLVDVRVWRAHQRLCLPMNQKRSMYDATGMEVGEAYEFLVETAINQPLSKDYPWILTYEEDNLPPANAWTKLMVAMRHCPDCKVPIGNADHCPEGHKAYDGVAGLYWTKSNPPSPMAFGDPKIPRDYRTQSIVSHVEAEEELDQRLEVNSIPMGFTLYRADLFRRMERPWFVTDGPEIDASGMPLGAVGQDVYFCMKARETAGARFAVHCGVHVGHIDYKTGKVW